MNDKMRYKGYTADIEYSEADQCFVGKVGNLRHAVLSFAGTTQAALEQEFRETVDDYLASCAEDGDTPERQLPVVLTLHISERAESAAKKAAERAHLPLDEWAAHKLEEAALLEA
jgi:predicted HicB family RNase H-like nuclease